MIPILSLLVVLTLSILMTRIANVAITYTGFSRESAKFQVRSAFTGVGIAINGSEKAVNHPIRRRIMLMRMLLGNAGVITAFSWSIQEAQAIQGQFYVMPGTGLNCLCSSERLSVW